MLFFVDENKALTAYEQLYLCSWLRLIAREIDILLNIFSRSVILFVPYNVDWRLVVFQSKETVPLCEKERSNYTPDWITHV